MTDALDPDLVDATARLLDRGGLAALSITSIAEEAGISRVTAHRRGAAIDDYVIAVIGRASDDLRASLWPVLTDGSNAADRLQVALRILCEVCERHGGVMRALYSVPARPLPDTDDRTTSFQFIEPFERLLRDGQLDGSLVVDDSRAEATITANSVAWTYLHMRHAHGWDVATATERTVRLATAHLLPA